MYNIIPMIFNRDIFLNGASNIINLKCKQQYFSIMRFSILLLLTGFYACGQQSENKKHVVDPKARQLNDSATSIAMHAQDYNKAISLLDQATQIDSNYLTAYANKLSFQLELKQFDKALATAKNLNRIKPEAPEYFVSIGLIYEHMGDTTSSNKFFNEAVNRYNKILDTMSTVNKDYDLLLMNKAVSLILVGQQQKGNDILKGLYDKQKDESYREMLSSFMNKSRKDILDNLRQTN